MATQIAEGREEDEEFTYRRFRELIHDHQRQTGATPEIIMLTQIQFDLLRRNLTAAGMNILIQEADITNELPTLNGIGIEICPEDARAAIATTAGEAITETQIREMQYLMQEAETGTDDLIREPVRGQDDWQTQDAAWRITTTQETRATTPAVPMSREALYSEIIFNIQEDEITHDVQMSGDLRLTQTIRIPMLLRTNAGRYTNDVLRDRIVDHYYNLLTPPSVYKNLDDELRDFIFWMHQNITTEQRIEADRRFFAMRDRIWPEDS